MCTNPTKTTKCASFYDSCMTISTRVKSLAGEMAFESMSCGYRAGCELAKQHACDNSTGMLDECSVSCCQGDLCNSGSGETTPPKGRRLLHVRLAIARHFGSVLVNEDRNIALATITPSSRTTAYFCWGASEAAVHISHAETISIRNWDHNASRALQQ